jgi:hypothetical protein
MRREKDVAQRSVMSRKNLLEEHDFPLERKMFEVMLKQSATNVPTGHFTAPYG